LFEAATGTTFLVFLGLLLFVGGGISLFPFSPLFFFCGVGLLGLLFWWEESTDLLECFEFSSGFFFWCTDRAKGCLFSVFDEVGFSEEGFLDACTFFEEGGFSKECVFSEEVFLDACVFSDEGFLDASAVFEGVFFKVFAGFFFKVFEGDFFEVFGADFSFFPAARRNSISECLITVVSVLGK
jgi:hypothetical protein